MLTAKRVPCTYCASTNFGADSSSFFVYETETQSQRWPSIVDDPTHGLATAGMGNNRLPVCIHWRSISRLTPCGCWGLMRIRIHCKFWNYIDSLCVCFPYHLLPFASCNWLPFSVARIFISYLLLLLTVYLRIAPLHFQAGCRRRWLNLGYNFSRFCCCIFVFDDLYFAIDLLSIGSVLC